MIIAVPSALCAKRFERACGAPSIIQCGRMGSSRSSMSAGAANMTASDKGGTSVNKPGGLKRGNANKA